MASTPWNREKDVCVYWSQGSWEPSLLMVPVNQLSKSGQREVSRSSPVQRYSGNPGSRARDWYVLQHAGVPAEDMYSPFKSANRHHETIRVGKKCNFKSEKSQHWGGENSGENSKLK